MLNRISLVIPTNYLYKQHVSLKHFKALVKKSSEILRQRPVVVVHYNLQLNLITIILMKFSFKMKVRKAFQIQCLPSSYNLVRWTTFCGNYKSGCKKWGWTLQRENKTFFDETRRLTSRLKDLNTEDFSKLMNESFIGRRG